MLKTDLYSPDGKVLGKIDLSEELFGAKVNLMLMAQAVRVYLSNQRRSRAKTKGRGEIKLTTRKWYRQKGTGRARHGAKSAPIFVGGSKAHGPTGKENYSLKLSKKMKRAALVSALTKKFQDQQVKVVDSLDKVKAKTKNAAKVLGKLELEQSKVTVIMPEKLEDVLRAFRNLVNVELDLANQLNTYSVLNGGVLLFTKEAVERLGEVFGKDSGVKKLSSSEVKGKEIKPKVSDKKKTVVKKTVRSSKVIKK